MPWTSTTLPTERLVLRPFCDDDRDAVIAMSTDPVLRRYLGGPVDAAELDVIRSAAIGERWGVFCVEHRLSTDVIGSCSFSRDRGPLELSYHLMPAYWGHGFATEACQAALDWAWTVHDDLIIAVTQVANAPSRRLLSRLGFAECETFVEWDAEQVVARLDRGSTCSGIHLQRV